MADAYAYTEKGSVFTGQARGSEAADTAFRMVRIIEAAQRKHNFTPTEALLLIGAWEELGESLRSPDYHRLVSWAWFTTNPTTGPTQPSQILKTELQRLRGAAEGANTMARVMAFNSAEKAMLAFVSAFRAKLQGKEKETFDMTLKNRMFRRNVSPGLQHL